MESFATANIRGFFNYERFVFVRIALVTILWLSLMFLEAPSYICALAVALAWVIAVFGPARFVYRGKIVGVAYPARLIQWEDDRLPMSGPLYVDEENGEVTVKARPFDPSGGGDYRKIIRLQSPWAFKSIRAGSCPAVFRSESQP